MIKLSGPHGSGGQLFLKSPQSLMIKKGSIVAYKDGYQRVTAVFKDTCNLGGIFTSRINHKKVPLNEVREAYEEWYAKWQQSETYRCM